MNVIMKLVRLKINIERFTMNTHPAQSIIMNHQKRVGLLLPFNPFTVRLDQLPVVSIGFFFFQKSGCYKSYSIIHVTRASFCFTGKKKLLSINKVRQYNAHYQM